jgi:DNA-binding response OmpR family regulator
MRILVVDDQVDAADTLAELLRCEGHEVVVAYSPMDALKKSLETTPDVAFLDLVMPGMDGWQLAQAIRDHEPRAYLVALTGFGEDDSRIRSREAGLDMHLVKPIEAARLELVLARAAQIVATRKPAAVA